MKGGAYSSRPVFTAPLTAWRALCTALATRVVIRAVRFTSTSPRSVATTVMNTDSRRSWGNIPVVAVTTLMANPLTSRDSVGHDCTELVRVGHDCTENLTSQGRKRLSVTAANALALRALLIKPPFMIAPCATTNWPAAARSSIDPAGCTADVLILYRRD